MTHPEYLQPTAPYLQPTPESDRAEIRRLAKEDASLNERYLRDLMGDDVYEDWDND